MTRPDSPEWLAAKAEGDRAELAIAEWFRSRGYEPYKTVGDVQFDLLLQCRAEVKNDRKAVETGNVAVEVEHNRQPSGIYTTDATSWVTVVSTEAFISKVATLRDLVLARASDFPRVPAGDGYRSTVLLVPVDEFRRISAQTFTLSSSVGV